MSVEEQVNVQSILEVTLKMFVDVSALRQHVPDLNPGTTDTAEGPVLRLSGGRLLAMYLCA